MITHDYPAFSSVHSEVQIGCSKGCPCYQLRVSDRKTEGREYQKTVRLNNKTDFDYPNEHASALSSIRFFGV